jgi:hypothetical protein
MLIKEARKLGMGDELKLFLMSDTHRDSPLCDRKKVKDYLDRCVDEKGELWHNGDWFDFLLFNDKKRGTLSNMGSLYDDQIGQIIDDSVEFLTPYAKAGILKGFGVGNHETSVIKYHGIDPIKLMLSRLMDRSGKKIHHMGYTGFLRYIMEYNSGTYAYDIWYHHGSGGGGKSKGILQHNDVASNYVADLYWMGHNHANITDHDYPLTYITSNGQIVTKARKFVRTAGYQRDDRHLPEDYMERGYKLDWGKEKFLRHQSKGSQIVTLKISRDIYETGGKKVDRRSVVSSVTGDFS